MNTAKKIAAAALTLALACPVCGYAEDDITVNINGKTMEFDAEPRIVNDRTMVPMRAIFEELGCEVSWFEEDRLIIALKSPLIISMMIDSTVMPVQDIQTREQKIVTLDAAPVIEEDRTFVPVRAVSEALGAEVTWDEETRTVSVFMPM